MKLNPKDPRLTRGEYWLLESVAEWQLFVELLNAENLESCLNKSGHGMGVEETIETFWHLYSAGLIFVSRGKGEVVALNREELAGRVTFPEPRSSGCQVYYGLTAEGGRLWEAFAAPKWECFIDASVGGDERREYHEAGAASKWRLEKYLSLVKQDQTVDDASIQWETCEPWQATYWKELPSGHRLTFNSRAGNRQVESDRHWEWVNFSKSCWYAWG